MSAWVHLLCEVLSQLGAARRALEPRVTVVAERADNGPRRPSMATTRTSANPASATSAAAEWRYGKAVDEPEAGDRARSGQHGPNLAATSTVRPPLYAQSRTAINCP